jgi:hypothetical protein
MFFDEEKDPVGSSAVRYASRQVRFVKEPKLYHTALWVLHNCVAHPLLGILPCRETVDIHKLTSMWLNKEKALFRSGVVPVIPNRKAWVVHNVVAHTLIGVAPCKTTFEYHDRTAREMAVPGWI